MNPLRSLLTNGVRAVYQPIVDIDSGSVVAYEALARGPAGTALESPAALFAAARVEGCIAELDWACRAAAVRGAIAGALRPPLALFGNVEPEALGVAPDAGIAHLFDRASTDLRVFVEVTERSLTHNPAQLLESMQRVRQRGFGIALDDVGADPRSLALLPLLRPDVVKLDLKLIHDHPSRAAGEVMNGVCAYAERSGASIVAEGVENERHLQAARSLGATLAQGWHFGRPGPLPVLDADVPEVLAVLRPPHVTTQSPVELVHRAKGTRVGRKDVLLSVSRDLEAQAVALGPHAVVVAAFQDGRHFGGETRRLYERLAERTAFTAALGVNLPDPPGHGVRGASLERGDPLRDEWDLAVLGPHYAAALVARDLGDHGPDLDRRFEFVLTFDRDLVVDVARSLIARVSVAASASQLRRAA